MNEQQLENLAADYAATKDTTVLKAYQTGELITIILESGPKVRKTEEEFVKEIKAATKEKIMEQEIQKATAAIRGTYTGETPKPKAKRGARSE